MTSRLAGTGFVVLLVAVGCEERPTVGPGGQAGGNNVAQSPEVKEVPWDRLKLGEYLNGLDGGRVDVAAPEGWQIPPRRTGSICWFHRGGQVPRIVVTAEDASASDMATVTKEHLAEFVKAITAELQPKQKEMLEPPLAMVLGDRPCARYVSGGRISGKAVDRQIVVTQVNGRRYTVELDVYAETIKQYRDAGYAVLAGMKFHDVASGAGSGASGSGDANGTSTDSGST